MSRTGQRPRGRVERVVREDGRCRVALDVEGQRLDAYAADPSDDGAVEVGLPRSRTAALDTEL